MRTTLSLDEDVLTAAAAIAGQRGRTTGEVISDLARLSLQRPAPKAERNGIPLLAPHPDAAPLTLEIVNAPRDEGA